MRLLLLTQKVDLNDDVLGFMHGWIKEFSKYYEKVIVICLFKGEYNFPRNVKVLSLGKEKGVSRLKYIFNFYKYIWRERKKYDRVFVHMNQGYVILGSLLWRGWRKKTGLWYAHGHVPFSLRVAEKFSNLIFTSTKTGFRIKSKKVNVVGQGIDVNIFKPSEQTENKSFKIITIGRISPVKGYDILIKAAEILRKENYNIKISIVGGAGLPDQEKYLERLKSSVKEKNLEGVITFVGAVANKDIVNYLRSSNLFVNMSSTGSLDKAMVEAMACGLPVLTCNEAMKEVLGDLRDKLMYPKEDYSVLADSIKMIKNMERVERKNLGNKLRNIVKNNHSLEDLIKKITKILNV